MADDTDWELEALKPRRRPWMIVVLANVLLFGSLAVAPYFRGHAREAEVRGRFAVFAACLFGADALPSPGLGLPAGDTEAYAAQVLRAEADWPRRCQAPLAAIALEPATFLLPWVKQSEVDVHAATRLVSQELDALEIARRTRPGVVPDRPLRAVGRLRAALAAYGDVVGTLGVLSSEAIVLRADTSLPKPEKIPLAVAADATTRLVLVGDGLYVVAYDRRAVSRVKVGGGGLDPHRFGRSNLVRGVLGPEGAEWLVWGQDAARCEGDADHCARFATGFAELPRDATRAPRPRWVQAHLAGRVDRTAAILDDSSVLLVARVSGSDAGTFEAARFALGHGDPDAGATDAAVEAGRVDAGGPDAGVPNDAGPRDARPDDGGDAAADLGESAPEVDSHEAPIAAITRFALPGSTGEDVPVLLSQDPWRVAWTHRSEGRVDLWLASPSGATEQVTGPTTPGAFLTTCTSGDTAWAVWGGTRGVAVARIPAGAPATQAHRTELELDARLDPADPTRDSVRVVCDAQGVLAALDRPRTDGLELVACPPSGACTQRTLAPAAERFDLARDGELALLAYARSDAIHVQRLGVDGAPLGPELLPAACWEPRDGFCGAPFLAVQPGRFVLAARDEADLLTLESVDGGRSWRRMSGLRRAPATR